MKPTKIKFYDPYTGDVFWQTFTNVEAYAQFLTENSHLLVHDFCQV